MGFYERRMDQELAPLLYKEEKVQLFVRQSRLHSLTPDFVIATDRRIIIIKNSFLGLYTGKNILGNTSYNSVPYRQITSVIMSKGMSMRSVIIRLQGTIDNTTKNEGEINGLWSKDAENLVKSIEHMMEHHYGVYNQNQPNITSGQQQHQIELYDALINGNTNIATLPINEIDISEAINMVNQKGQKIVWLGNESAELIGKRLNLNSNSIIKINPDKIIEADVQIGQLLYNNILLCYNGGIAKHIAAHLKNSQNIELYVIKGGILSFMDK